jgi:OOP family OmpA-OmpF porin
MIFPLFLAASGAGCTMMASSAPPPPDTVVFFQPQTAVLDAPALHIIASAAATAQTEPDAPITITGAADTVGALKDNEKLSIERAQAVANTLEADGVAASRITVRGVGEMSSPAPGMQFSRRVMIHIGA